MKIYKKSLYIGLLFILIGLSFLVFSNNVVGAETLDFTFDTIQLYNEVNPESDFTYNIRNQTEYTEIFNASYSFTGDNIASIPEGFTVDETGGSVRVYTSNYGHSEIVRMIDDGNDLEVSLDRVISRTSGTIEFYILFAQTNHNLYHYIMEDVVTSAVNFNWASDGKIKYYDTSWKDIGSYVSNTWYHYSINFECGDGNYKGLSPDTFNIYINGKKFGDYSFRGTAITMNNVRFRSNTDVVGITDLDAYGEVWDEDYNEGDNVVPYSYILNITEVDKWEFFNNEDGSATAGGQTSIPFFTEIGDDTTITKNIDSVEDETTTSTKIADTPHQGFYRNINIDDGIIRRISFRYLGSFFRSGNAKAYVNFDIDSYDDTLICRLRIDDSVIQKDLLLYYYDGSDYIELEDIFNIGTFYDINITIMENIVSLQLLNITGETMNTYIFPTITNKAGLGDVTVEGWGEYFQIANYGFAIDSIGVYINGISVCNDFANYYYETGKDFNSDHDNLFNINATGFFGCSMISFAMTPETYVYFSYQNVSEISFINTHTGSPNNVKNSYLAISANDSYNIYSVLIEGTYMIEGINSYGLNFEYSNIDITYNYFYEVNNRLYWNLTIDDNNLEFLKATFEISNLQSENRSINFKSNINGNARGFLSLIYTDTSDSIFEFPYYSTTTNVILPQTQEIDKFVILITDNDESNNGYSVGYISSISLIYYPDLATTITSLNLLSIIVPLIILIAPPMALQKKFGSKIILPMFILMSIICVATQLIPVWLFFIIAFASIGFIVLKEKVEVKI